MFASPFSRVRKFIPFALAGVSCVGAAVGFHRYQQAQQQTFQSQLVRHIQQFKAQADEHVEKNWVTYQEETKEHEDKVSGEKSTFETRTDPVFAPQVDYSSSVLITRPPCTFEDVAIVDAELKRLYSQETQWKPDPTTYRYKILKVPDKDLTLWAYTYTLRVPKKISFFASRHWFSNMYKGHSFECHGDRHRYSFNEDITVIWSSVPHTPNQSVLTFTSKASDFKFEGKSYDTLIPLG